MKPFSFVIVYLDDVVIFSESLDEYFDHMLSVLKQIRGYKLKVKPSKCCFAQREVNLLGYVTVALGVRVDPKKLSAIQKVPTPSSKTELQSFLGLAGYYRRFIKEFPRISAVSHQ